MAEAALIGPLLKFLGVVYEGFSAYENLDGSVKAFVEQVQLVHSSLKRLSDAILKRKKDLTDRFGPQAQDSLDQDLNKIIKRFNDTTKETEEFFGKCKISIKISKFEKEISWNADVQRSPKTFFQHDQTRKGLQVCQQRYRNLEYEINYLSLALAMQKMGDPPISIATGSHITTRQGRLHDCDCDLLTLPRTLPIETEPESGERMPDPKGKRKSVISTGEKKSTALSESELQYKVQEKHTPSQEHLFSLFGKELQSYGVNLGWFNIDYLLHKVSSWLNECSPDWPEDTTKFAINYVKLMKSGWLVREIITNFDYFSVSSAPSLDASASLVDLVLFLIQEDIFKLHPVGRKPPEFLDLPYVPQDIIKLGLDPAEIYNANDDDEYIVFERTLVCKGDYDNEVRRIRVIRSNIDFASGTPGKSESNTITIDDRNILGSQEKVFGDPKYDTRNTLFTPVFYSPSGNRDGVRGEGFDQRVYIRRKENGFTSSDRSEIIFTSHNDAKAFQHSICDYKVIAAINPENASIGYRRIPRTTEDITAASVQIWVKAGFKTIDLKRSMPIRPPKSQNAATFSEGDAEGEPIQQTGLQESHTSFPRLPISSGSSGATYSSNTSPRVAKRTSMTYHRPKPECPRLLVYGHCKTLKSEKRLIMILMNSSIIVDKDGGCCRSQKKPKDEHGLSCCRNILITCTPDAIENAFVYTGKANNIFSSNEAGTGKGSEMARIALPIDISMWASVGKKIKLDHIYITFETAIDKKNFYTDFIVRKGRYTKAYKAFKTEVREFYKLQGFY